MTLVLNGTTGVSAVDGSAATPAIQGNDSNTGIFFPAADTIAFAEGGAEVARFNSSGNLGIGTSSPADRLHVSIAGAEVARFTNSQSNGGDWEFKIGGGGFEDRKLMITDKFSGADNVRVSIDSSGRLLVGTTSAPSQTGGVVVANNELFVSNIPTTASGANCHISSGEGNRFYRSTSALKYKQDIRDIESVDISKFRPVRYKSKCENDDQTKDHFGFIADEAAAEGFEELVTRGADGEVEGFQYDRMTVVLVKAIQEQQALIAALQADVAALKGQA